jgi:integrase/recombinase XerD
MGSDHGTAVDAEAEPTQVELPLEVEEFLTWLSVDRGRSANTIAAYRRDLRAYCAFLRVRDLAVDTATEATIASYVGELRGSGKAASSVARAMVAVRALHRFLADEEIIERDATAEVELPRVPRGLPKALAESEVNDLLQAVVGDDPIARRDRAVLEVLYGTGLRISELVGLSRRDVDLESGLLRALGKGSKERVVPLGRMARAALQQWLAPDARGELAGDRALRRDDADAVFVNVRGGRLSRQGAWGIVRKYGDQVGLAGRLTPHVLRHSCATHMLDHGADVRAVQELLGHASISTTQVYTMVSTERLRAVYEAAHPRAAGKGTD